VQDYFNFNLICFPSQITRKHGFSKICGSPVCRVYDAFIMERETGKDIAEIVVENQMAKYSPGAEQRVKLWKAACLAYLNKMVHEATRVEDTDEEDEFGIGEDDEFEVYLGFDAQTDDTTKAGMAKKILTDFGVGEFAENGLGSLEHSMPPSPKAIGGTPAVAGNAID